MRNLEQLSHDLQNSHEITHSWRKTARPYDLYPSMARLIANGYDPGPRIRRKLGLPLVANVIVIAGEVPAGSQVLSADRCACGQYFISNHPRRKRCFMCSPYKRRSRS